MNKLEKKEMKQVKKMNKEFPQDKVKVIYRTGEFTDYLGIRRPYCFAGKLTVDKFGAVLEIGLSVVHPDDLGNKIDSHGNLVPIYSEEIGKKIALGKAEKSDRIIDTTCKNLLCPRVVDVILDQEEKHFLQSPENYLKGYREKLKKRNKLEKLERTVPKDFNIDIHSYTPGDYDSFVDDPDTVEEHWSWDDENDHLNNKSVPSYPDYYDPGTTFSCTSSKNGTKCKQICNTPIEAPHGYHK